MGSGGARVLIVGLSINGAAIVTSVSYAGVAMNHLGTESANGNTVDMWWLLDPTPGTNTIQVAATGNRRTVGGAASFTDVASVGGFTAASGRGGTASVIVASLGQVIVDTVATTGNALPISPAAGQTERWNNQTGSGGGDAVGGGSSRGGLLSVATAWQLQGNENWSIGATTLRPC